MRYKPVLGVLIFVIFSTIVFANVPPPIPTEYWGRLLIDGELAPDGTEVSYFNGDEWAITTTVDGWYSLMLTGGDSDLTFADDHECVQHWADEEACIPCNPGVDCIEGPQEGDEVDVYVDDIPVSVDWGGDASIKETQFRVIRLNEGWNLRSLPLKENDNSIERIIHGLSGQIVIWNYNESGDWNVYDTEAPFPWINTLQTLEYGKAYWIKSEMSQDLALAGTPAGEKTIVLREGWNFVGFNSSQAPIPEAISGLESPLVIWGYNESGDWNVYDTEAPFPWINTLKDMKQSMGYWIKSAIQQAWQI
ncbi:hypothetical protein KY358_03830 [Candidatus Woesearchaeota archaeon]|nr:hypothetical protein [Candidatus Woesearchaeota archaeon]